jgi:hypothetical protein
LVRIKERKKPNETANQRDQINPSRPTCSAILAECSSVASPFAGSSVRILSFINHNGQTHRAEILPLNGSRLMTPASLIEQQFVAALAAE